MMPSFIICRATFQCALVSSYFHPFYINLIHHIIWPASFLLYISILQSWLWAQLENSHLQDLETLDAKIYANIHWSLQLHMLTYMFKIRECTQLLYNSESYSYPVWLLPTTKRNVTENKWTFTSSGFSKLRAVQLSLKEEIKSIMAWGDRCVGVPKNASHRAEDLYSC